MLSRRPAFPAFLMILLQKPPIIIAKVSSLRIKVLIGFQDDHAKEVLLDGVLLGGKGIFLLGVCQVRSLFAACFLCVLEGIQEPPALDRFLFVDDMRIDSIKDAFKRKHSIVRNAYVIPLDWSKEVKIRAVPKLIPYPAGRKAFVGNDDPFADIIVTDKAWIPATHNYVD